MNRKNDFMQPSEKEIAELEAQRQQEHEQAENFNAEVAGSKGEAYPDDPFYGGTAADVKARRHARGQFAKEDFEIAPADPISDYTGPTTGDQVRTLEELRAYVTYKENLAREKYPDYDENINRYLLPDLEGVDQQEFQRWLLENDDFTEKSYQTASAQKKRLRNRAPSMEEVDRMTAEEFTERLESLRTGRAEEAEEKEPEQEFISKREMKRLNKISNPVDFGAALDRLKWRG